MTDPKMCPRLRRFTVLICGVLIVCVSAVLPAAAIEIAKDRAVKSDLAAESLLLGVDEAGRRLVAVGEYGHVLLSDDRGVTWRQAESVPTDNTLTTVHFVDGSHGWMGGHEGIILHSEDGGETWTQQYDDPESDDPILSILFLDREHGFAFGAFALMLETKDGGKTWTKREIVKTEDELAPENHLNGAFEGMNDTIFVAAEFGAVYRSADNGATWSEIATGYEGSFWNGLTLNDGTVLVFGMRGNVWRSEDGGLTFAAVPTAAKQSVGGGTELIDGTVVLVGLGGAVLYSHDGGRSFEAMIRDDRKGLNAVAPGTGEEVNVFGEAGVARQPVPSRVR